MPIKRERGVINYQAVLCLSSVGMLAHWCRVEWRRGVRESCWKY